MTFSDYYEVELEKIHENKIINQIRTLKYLNQDSEQIIKYLEDSFGWSAKEIEDALDKFEKSSNKL